MRVEFRPGAVIASLVPLAIWGVFALGATFPHQGWVFLVLTLVGGAAVFVLARRASVTDRVVASAGTTLAALATVIGLVIDFVILLRFDACPGSPNGGPLPSYAAVTEWTVLPVVYIVAAWLLLRHRRSPLLLPIATILAWLAVAIAFVLFAAAGYPHHCET